MGKANDALFVDESLCGDSPQFEQVDFLAVKFQDAVGWVGQADKRKFVRFPIQFEMFSVFRTDHDDLGFLSLKFCIVAAQLRHVPLAEWSDEAAVEYQ